MKNLDMADLKYFSYAEWISGDYSDFVKKSVLPLFSKRYPLKIREARVLNSIAHAQTPPTSSEVSDDLRQDPATVTRSVVILTGKGYVITTDDCHDGRSRRLNVTPQGEMAAEYFLELFASLINHASGTQHPDRASLDHSILTRSLETVAYRARAFREAQRELAGLLGRQQAAY